MLFKALFSVSSRDFPALIERLEEFGVIANWIYTSDNELEVYGRWTYPMSNTVLNESDKVIRIEIEQDEDTQPKPKHTMQGIVISSNSWDL